MSEPERMSLEQLAVQLASEDGIGGMAVTVNEENLVCLVVGAGVSFGFEPDTAHQLGQALMDAANVADKRRRG